MSEWLLETVSDDRGNVTTYGYKSEDLASVDPADIAERHRLDAAAPTGRYLKTVHYANTVPETTSHHCFLVTFDYGEHEDTPSEVRPWPVRDDPFSSYRTGFELRTWRLCRRVLMFHDLPNEFADGPNPRLVAATELIHAGDPVATKLRAVRHVGYEYIGGAYATAALPPVEFVYTTAAPDDNVRTVRVDPVAGAAGVQWIDLDGDGLPGVLSRTPGAWRYQRNAGGGVLEPSTVVTATPATGQNEPLYFADLGGTGRLALVRTSGPLAGSAERTDDGWGPLRPFTSQPVLDANDPRLWHIDLDGDGRPDLMYGCAEGIRWHQSLGRDGYGPARFVPALASNDELGLQLSYRDQEHTIFLADMSGDGLTDVVRIRNGEVCYWPNLGYGRFGARVTMAGAPWFDHPERYDPSRLRLADLDGTGPTDLVYLGCAGVTGWVNQAGNSFAPGVPIGPAPSADNTTMVDVVDLLGTGTGCLMWTSTLSADAVAPTRYLDLSRGTGTGLDPADDRLAGWKRNLICEVRNNVGSVMTVEYAPSTRYSLADRRARQPWLTRLPFPVQVVAAIAVADGVTGDTLQTTYRYRNGYFDGEEQEFRGFGMVETTDAESLPAQDPTVTLDLPPTRTRSWFHLGAPVDTLSDAYAGDPAATSIDADQIDTNDPDAWRQSLRALTGRPLRTEVYADDGTSVDPYTVEEHRYAVRQEQPAAGNPYAVVFGYQSESISYHYERNPVDPRMARQVTLAIDPYGTVTSSLAIALSRRTAGLPDQQRPLLTLSTTDVANVDTATVLRLGLPVATGSFEVTDLAVPNLATASPADFSAALIGITNVPFEQAATPGAPSRRVLSATRTEYWSDDLSAGLPAGAIGSRALLRRSYRLAYTAGLLAAGYGSRIDTSLLSTAGYVQLPDDPGSWWAPSELRGYDPTGFYAAATATDPFGNTAAAIRDPYHLFVVTVSASDRPGLTGLVTHAAHDYRVLAPRAVTDPNGNGGSVAFDVLGRVSASWVRSKTAGEGDPDPLPGTVYRYDADCWRLDGTPVWSETERRERYGDPASGTQRSRLYADGFARTAMSKVQAESGLAWTADGAGGVVVVDTGTAVRWIGSGRTVYNNKGLPVEQYEPYFAATVDYEKADALVKHDAPRIMHYDPLGRPIRTDLPDGTYLAATFDPWRQIAADANDTVADSGWYAERQTAGTTPEQARAATLAYAHRNTPTVADLDVLGRTIRTTADNGPLGRYTTLVELDILGNSRSVTDARGIVSIRLRHDLLGRIMSAVDVDTGTRVTFTDCVSAPVRAWTARGDEIGHSYDALHRPTAVWIRDAGDPTDRLAELTVYGETHPTAVTANLRGAVYRHYDQAGVTRSDRYDFLGRPISTVRLLATVDRTDWAGLDTSALMAIDTAAAGRLDTAATFTSATTYDALGRAITQTLPDGTVHTHGYNTGGLTATLHTSRGDWSTTVVTGADYDVRRRRAAIRYGNGTITTYDYDPRSYRLIRLRTTSGPRTIQDLAYTYDPVGNVLEVTDGAAQAVFFAGTVSRPGARYTYEPVYRLATATGREHASLAAPVDTSEPTYAPLPHPNDPSKIRSYTETYGYDPVDNVLSVQHTTNTTVGGWTRLYDYIAGTNRLARFTGTGSSWLPPCTYDPAGNVTSMPYLPGVTWDATGRLTALNLGGGGTTTYTHDPTGLRIRRTWTHTGLTDEYVYLGSYERYRRYRGDTIVLERHTSHIDDETARVALVETLTVDTDAPASKRDPRIRYQLTDQRGSTTVECDDTGAVLSYEEYHPYGTAAMWLARGQAQASPRRYRYAGKEKDAESGLFYFGARYYSPWLGRWFSPDPVGRANPYAYCSDDPIGRIDPDGRDDIPREFYNEKITGKESQDKVRAMFSGRGVFYQGNATLVMTAGTGDMYWYLDPTQVIARETGTQLNVRGYAITGPSGPKATQSSAKPKQTIAEKDEERFHAAARGMWDEVVDQASGLVAAGMELMDPERSLDPGRSLDLPGETKKLAEGLKFGGPKKTGDAERDADLKENYEQGHQLVGRGIFVATVLSGAAELEAAAELARAADLAKYAEGAGIAKAAVGAELAASANVAQAADVTAGAKVAQAVDTTAAATNVQGGVVGGAKTVQAADVVAGTEAAASEAPGFGVSDNSEAAAESLATGNARRPNGYSVIVEMKLEERAVPYSVEAEGMSPKDLERYVRERHRIEFNMWLREQFEDPEMARSLTDLGVTKPWIMPNGYVTSVTPKGYVIHHDTEGLLQLVPGADPPLGQLPQHVGGTFFYDNMHPNGKGGMALWGYRFGRLSF